MSANVLRSELVKRRKLDKVKARKDLTSDELKALAQKIYNTEVQRRPRMIQAVAQGNPRRPQSSNRLEVIPEIRSRPVLYQEYDRLRHARNDAPSVRFAP